MIEPRPYQTEALKAVLENWHNGVNRQLISLPTGCHAAGTKILMFDGGLKNVEDVAIDDLLMGPDSTPRRVLSLVYGEDDMYRINPVKGEPFTVNGKHILSLKRTPIKNPSNGRAAPSQTGGQIINISVVDYLQRTNNFKHIHKLYRVPKDAAWRTRPATEKQINILKKAGIAFKPDLTRGEAMSMIEARSNLPATDKQKWFITKHRLHPTPDLLTIKQASQIIGKFKQQQAS